MMGDDNNTAGSVDNVEVAVTSTKVLVGKNEAKKSPFLKRQLSHPTTDTDTLIHLCKGSLGTGVLAMPYAFSNIGIVMGVPATLFIGFVCAYCVHMMVEAAHELCWRHDLASIDFGTLAEYAVKYGPKKIHKFSGFARGTIQTFIVLVAMGACCVYIVFVSENISSLVDNDEIDIKLYILMVTVVMLGLVMIRNLRWLSPLSLLSNALVLASIVIIFIYIFDDLPHVSERPHFVSVRYLPVFFSTAVFALEGITVVMPLENNMKTPQHFLGPFRVLTTAMTFIVCIYALVGFFGYLKYGEEVQGSISLNLPAGEPLAMAVQGMLAVAIAFTYPLQFYCSIDFTWPGLSRFLTRKFPKQSWLGGLPGEYIYRVLLVLVTMSIALAIPNLEALMGLIGAVCLSTVGIMFPSVLQTIVYWDNLGTGYWVLWKNLLIFIFGLAGFSTGLYTSIRDLIEA